MVHTPLTLQCRAVSGSTAFEQKPDSELQMIMASHDTCTVTLHVTGLSSSGIIVISVCEIPDLITLEPGGEY